LLIIPCCRDGLSLISLSWCKSISALGEGTDKGERVKRQEPIITQHDVANLLASSIYTMAIILSFQYGCGDGKTSGDAGE
jgi:hypothetical protein